MIAAEPTLLAYFAEIVLGLFPWAERFGLTPSGGLSIKSASEAIAIDASERIDIGEHSKAVALAGGSRGGALTTSDTGGKFAFDPGVPSSLAPALYYLPPGSLVPALVTLLPAGSTIGGTVPPLPVAFGTAVVLGPGSQKVSSG